jgi:hypothetical protein
MKTSFWFSALGSFISVALGFAAAAAMVPRVRDQFPQPTVRKHLGRLLISQMKASRAELKAIPQFDCGRWKLRLERVPNERQTANHEALPIRSRFGAVSKLAYEISRVLKCRSSNA